MTITKGGIFLSETLSKPKEITLNNGWTIIAHETISAFVSLDNPDKYTVLDWDDDQMLILTADENSVDVHSFRYGLKYKVNLSNRSFTVFAEPDEEE